MAARINWYYYRAGCTSCRRAQEVIDNHDVDIAEQVNARKDRIGPAQAIEMIRQANELWVSRGKKILHFDLKKDPPADDELEKLVIGPSGNLRAPTLRRGKKMFVGFHPELSEFLAN